MAAADVARSPEQATRERGLTKVFDSLEEIELVASRVRKYRDEVATLPGCDDLVMAMSATCDQLESIRKELQQRAYFNQGQNRLF